MSGQPVDLAKVGEVGVWGEKPPTKRDNLSRAAEQALEALESLDCGDTYKTHNAASALRQALAEPEKTNQCGESCERAKLCATCARELAPPEQEPVAWLWKNTDGSQVITDDPDYADGTWIPLYTAPVDAVNMSQERVDETAKGEHEPFEYWNAVEGWVKIDEVRQHFDSVGCGTIYKTSGENRVPLYTAPPKRAWVGLTDDERDHFRSLGFVGVLAVEAKLKEKNNA